MNKTEPDIIPYVWANQNILQVLRKMDDSHDRDETLKGEENA